MPHVRTAPLLTLACESNATPCYAAVARCARRCGSAPATSSWCPCVTTRCGGLVCGGRWGARPALAPPLQDDKGDVILKYTADEARQLKSSGQLPENGASPGVGLRGRAARPHCLPRPCLQSSSTRASAAARTERTEASTSTTTTAAQTTTSTSTPSECSRWRGGSVARLAGSLARCFLWFFHGAPLLAYSDGVPAASHFCI